MDCAEFANIAASGLVTLACIVFAVVYHVYAPWRSTTMGRHLMTFTLAIGALGAYTVAITVWSDGAVATVLRSIRTLLMFVIALLVMQRTRMVWRAQHNTPLHPSEAGSPAEPGR